MWEISRKRHNTTEPERFRIDTGLSGKVKEREIFVSETIKNDLEQPWPAQGWSDLEKNITIVY